MSFNGERFVPAREFDISSAQARQTNWKRPTAIDVLPRTAPRCARVVHPQRSRPRHAATTQTAENVPGFLPIPHQPPNEAAASFHPPSPTRPRVSNMVSPNALSAFIFPSHAPVCPVPNQCLPQVPCHKCHSGKEGLERLGHAKEYKATGKGAEKLMMERQRRRPHP